MNTVLVAEDEPEVRDYLGLALSCGGYGVEFASNGEEVVDCLKQRGGDISLLLLDLIMPKKDGLQTLGEIQRSWPRLPVITVSGCCTPANVASAMKGGAVDFLAKPVGHAALLGAVEAALSFSRLNASASHGAPSGKERQKEQCSPESSLYNTSSAWAHKVENLLVRVGSSDAPVLLRGETGVGKEVLARALHNRSKRAGRPFLKLNCAALPSELVESELFGYEKGAFTGAFKKTPGKFEIAHKGTILLDEIGDMDFKLQAKLLQVLQDREFLRIGAKEASRVDVRIMAATHCNLEEAIAQGRFREDLFYRLNVLDVFVPPLRKRKDEIVALAEFFLDKYAPADRPELPEDLCAILLEHNWPGNVRELENVIRKFLVFRSVDLIAAELNERRPIGVPVQPVTPLPEHRAQILREAPRPERTSPSTLAHLDQVRKQAEVDAIMEALHSTRWNRKQAAKVLNIHYKALLYKMKKLGIDEAVPVRQ